MATELFAANQAVTTVTSGGTDAPAQGTQETWTVASSAMFGAASTGVSQFHVADPNAPAEMITVTNVSGTTWTVTRGAESTTPVAHTGGFTVYQVTTQGWLAAIAQFVQVPVIVFDGDSLTNGTGSLPYNNFPNSNDYPSQVVAGLDPKGSYYNVGVGGETVAQMIINAPTVVDTKLAAGANNIVCFAGGTNDLQGTDSASTTYSRIVTYCQARQAAGWKVIVSTITPRSDAGTPADFDMQRQSLNTSIRSNWATFANGLADIGGDATMGISGDEANTQYYNGDLVHHSPNGYAVRASYVLAALSQQLGVRGHRQYDRSGLVSDLWLAASDLYPTSGSPAEALISNYPSWSLHHGSVDVVNWTGILPREWLTFNVYAVWSNTAGASGNALLVLRYAAFTINNWSTPTNLNATLSSGGGQAVASPVAARPASTLMGTLTANNGAAPRVAWNIGIERNGTSGSDTLSGDVVGLLGIYLARAS
jgi:lysophospholipase L1-like esterase